LALVLKKCLLLLLTLNLLACTAGPQPGRQRLNLSPLLYYSSNPEGEVTRLEILGPLFSREVAGPNAITTLAPLFYVLKHGQESTSAEFFYPLGHYYHNAEEQRFNLLPLIQQRQEPSGGPTETQIFPFFWGRTAGGETYGGVFPLAGTFKKRYGRDSMFFLLWPLYSSSSGEGSYHYHFLWPFFSYSTGKETAHTFWPIAGKMNKPGVYEKFYTLWPLINYQRLNLDTERPRTLKTFLPFYLEETSPEYQRRSYGYPFFSHYHQNKGNYDQWDTPWPLIVRGDGEDFHLRAFRPFYYHRVEKTEEATYILWPMYAKDRQEKPASLEVTYRFLFFSTYRVRVNPQGNWEERSRLWPFYFYDQDSKRLKAHAPDLLPLQSQGWDLLFGPYLYLWSTEQQGGYRQGRALWGIYRWEETPDYWLWELSFLVSRSFSQRESAWRFLLGMVTYQRQGTHSSLQFFYLPWKVKW
jgi:hypothetical protein